MLEKWQLLPIEDQQMWPYYNHTFSETKLNKTVQVAHGLPQSACDNLQY